METKITVYDLTNLFKEKFYSIQYIDFETGEQLEPFDFSNVNDLLIVKGFKVYFDEFESITNLLIGVDKKQYISLKNDPNIGANLKTKVV